ncbi:MAG: SPFH domain-containing protein [Clostridia bacterium]|nr:SPFH domain-containing protein [Clostridia bacterium]
MGLFDKIKNQLLKVVHWEDDTNDTLVYRFPMEDRAIMTGSKLTVRPSQVAIFVHRGQIADIFGPGEYKLETRNLPFLTAIGNVFYQGDTRFKAEVYFVSTKQFTGLKWGTKNPVTMRDKEFDMIRIRAFGVYAFKVGDPKKLLEELFGTNSSFEVADIQEHITSHLITTFSDVVASSKVSALDMAINLREFNEMCEKEVQVDFDSLGLELTNFNIENISFPENVEQAIDERSSLGILSGKMGTYTQKKAADAMADAAKNTGSAGMFMGLGVGANAGGYVGQTMGNAVNTAKDETSGGNKYCPSCGTANPKSAKFCSDCGNPLAVAGVCPKCGANIEPGAKFCANCGEKL